MKITSRFVAEIDRAIKEGRLREPFRASDLRKAFGGFAFNTYSHFLSKHVLNNPVHYKEYFDRIELGLYRRLRN
jgi:hypothetical protein